MKQIEFSSIIVGKLKIDGKEFYAELIKDTLAIKSEYILIKKQYSKIVCNIIIFYPEARFGPIYYLYIDKRIESYYSYNCFHVLLLYRHYNDSIETQFEIISKGFSNSFNKPIRNPGTNIRRLNNNLNKEFLNTKINILKNKYDFSVVNVALLEHNNLCPAGFYTSLILKPLNKIFVDKIYDVFNFSIKLLQFITINSYPIIDNFLIRNNHGGYSKVEIFRDFSEYDTSNDKYLYLKCLGKKIPDFLQLFPNLMLRQYNLFYFKSGLLHEFDIVRLSGSFEQVFAKCVEKSKLYKKNLDKRKRKVHYDELRSILNEFSKKYKLYKNNDFISCRQNFDRYGGTLKNKLEFILIDFCKTMNFIIITNDFKLFYCADKFESRIKDARNAICHGLSDNKINWSNIPNDTLLLQELIYFIILKYKIGLNKKMTRDVLDNSFGYLNKRLDFYKKNDPRIKWSK